MDPPDPNRRAENLARREAVRILFVDIMENFPFTLVIAAALGVVGLVSYGLCFGFAAQTGRLKALDYVLGTAGMLCGWGFFYFLYRANTVTLQHSFALVERGGDPSVARALNKRFKTAAAVAVGSFVLMFFVR